MFDGLKKYISRNAINIPGWRTTRKILVIESDDWGTVRMASAEAYNALLKAGLRVDKDPYSRFDSIETSADMQAMFEVFKKHKDSKGNPVVLTANTIVANPDFRRIKDSGFNKYYYEPFTETHKKRNDGIRTLELWKQGIDNGLIVPQFHGREHVNVSLWMDALRSGNRDCLKAFEWNVFGINVNNVEGKRNNYMAAFDWYKSSEIEDKVNVAKDGLALFQTLFGFASKTMIAPCYIWSKEVEEALLSSGIEAFQGISYQYISNENDDWYSKKFHYTGQQNKGGQYYLVRNVFFEPSLTPKADVVGECLQRISSAFSWGKPAIIGSHRLNFMGTLDENNRSKNLDQLDELLRRVLQLWPNVEFLSSDSLLKEMKAA